MRNQASEPEDMVKRRLRKGRGGVRRAIGATTALLAVSALASAALVAFLPGAETGHAGQAPVVTAAVVPATPALTPAVVAPPVPVEVFSVPELAVQEASPVRTTTADASPPGRTAVAAEVQASPSLELPAETVALIQGGRARPTPDRAQAIDTAAAAPPASSTADRLPETEIAALMVRARDRVRQGDIAGARRLLERAASDALLALAETYDAATLARWGVIGTRPDNAMARSLYERAASRGASAARERLLALVQ
jgi:TPR repeat protein